MGKNINRGTNKRGMEEEKGLRDSKLPLILMEAIITGRKTESNTLPHSATFLVKAC